MARRKPKTNRGGGGRKTRYAKEDLTRADVEDVRASEANLSITDSLTAEAGQAMTPQRVKQIAEAVAQTAIEYSKNPTSAASALEIYADVVASMPSDLRAEVLQQADLMTVSNLPPSQMPSRVLVDGFDQPPPEM